MRSTIILACIATLGLLVGCGPKPEPAPSPFASHDDTSGGEDESAEEPEPVVLPSTTPVPVPQPAVPREELSEGVQQVWMRTERAVEVSPPAPPAEATVEQVQAWAEGPFSDWMRERRTAVAEAENDVGFLVSAPAAERGVTAALFGYMYEDTAAAMRGAPVPQEIAADPELLDIYVQTLSDALLPYARTSAEAYATCATTFAELGDEAWAPWAHYCAERAREVVDAYDLAVGSGEGEQAGEEQAGEEQASEEQAGEEQAGGEAGEGE